MCLRLQERHTQRRCDSRGRRCGCSRHSTAPRGSGRWRGCSVRNGPWHRRTPRPQRSLRNHCPNDTVRGRCRRAVPFPGGCLRVTCRESYRDSYRESCRDLCREQHPRRHRKLGRLHRRPGRCCCMPRAAKPKEQRKTIGSPCDGSGRKLAFRQGGAGSVSFVGTRLPARACDEKHRSRPALRSMVRTCGRSSLLMLIHTHDRS
jgi:hypothetical protein